MSIKDAILAVDDRPYEDVEVEEWGLPVRVRGLSAKDSEEFARRFGATDDDVPQGVLVDLVIRTLYDPETGERIFSEGDADALASRSAVVITRLFRVAQRLSGLGGEEEVKND